MHVRCRFIRDDAVEAEALRKAEAIAEAERKRVAASIRGSLNKQVGRSEHKRFWKLRLLQCNFMCM